MKDSRFVRGGSAKDIGRRICHRLPPSASYTCGPHVRCRVCQEMVGTPSTLSGLSSVTYHSGRRETGRCAGSIFEFWMHFGMAVIGQDGCGHGSTARRATPAPCAPACILTLFQSTRYSSVIQMAFLPNQATVNAIVHQHTPRSKVRVPCNLVIGR